MSSTSTHKEQFYSKLKMRRIQIVMSIGVGEKKMWSCDDDVQDLAKRIKKKIKRNGSTNVVCTMKKEAGNSEEILSLNISQIQICNSVAGNFFFSSVSGICCLARN